MSAADHTSPDQFDIGNPPPQYGSEDVAGMTSREFANVRHEAAAYQRGAPELAMDRIQSFGGGVYSYAAEHIGDLTHRMNEHGGKLGLSHVRPKVETQYSNLHSGYGFEREHAENLAGNQRSAQREGREFDAHGLRIAKLQYALAHAHVPVYNAPSAVARNAAISLGEDRFDATRAALSILLNQTSSDAEWHRRTSQAASIRFLQQRERNNWI